MIFFTDGNRDFGEDHHAARENSQDGTLFAVFANGAAAYAIACDGCGSAYKQGARTDAGSRNYAGATAGAIEVQFALTGDLASQEALAHVLREQYRRDMAGRELFRLTQGDMLSTVVMACVCPLGGMVHVQGDGGIAMVDDEGFVQMTLIEWAKNAPAYPAYRSDGYANFIAHQGGDLQANAVQLTEMLGQIDDPDSFEERVFYQTLEEGIENGYSTLFDASTLATARAIAVFTDGVQQVVSGGQKLDWWKVVAALLRDLKLGRAAFARKRLNMFLSRNRLQDGDGPFDDIAFAVIGIEPSDTKEE